MNNLQIIGIIFLITLYIFIGSKYILYKTNPQNIKQFLIAYLLTLIWPVIAMISEIVNDEGNQFKDLN